MLTDILDTNFSGVRAETSYGISQEGDAGNFYVGIKAGTDFAGGRGHIVVGGEYSDEGAIGVADSRDWGRKHRDFVSNPFWNSNPALSNGLPANVGSDNVTWTATRGGSVTVAQAFRGMQFDTNGELVPFPFGELFNPRKPGATQIGGDPTAENFTALGPPYLVAIKHYAMLGHVNYELTNSITGTVEVSYSNVDGGPTGPNPRADSNAKLIIRRDNAFLTPTVAAMMDSVGVNVIPVSRVSFEIGASQYTSNNKTWTALFGLDGDLGGNWTWDVSYLYGRTKGFQFNPTSRLERRWTDAIDAVFAPAGIPGIAEGTIICRSTIANPGNGCVPANIMGSGNISPEAVAWINTIAYADRKFTDHNFAANLRGTLFEGWAGPVSVAAGVEYRTNASEVSNDPNSAAGLFSQAKWNALERTTQKVTEGYLEVNLPVLADSPIGKSLKVNAAVRRTHYSISGNATTWKISGPYELNDEYMFRVTRSHDIRAPSALETNPGSTNTITQISDPKQNINYFVESFSGGNLNLRVEDADTLTIGGALQPNWIPNFRLSVDYYDIKVGGAIDIATKDLAVEVCRSGKNPAICTVGTDVSGNPDRILALYATYQNLTQLHAEGVEVVANYRQDLADVADFLSGDLNITLNGSYFITLSTLFPDGTVKELADWTGATGLAGTFQGVPRWRGDAVVTYSKPSYSFTAHMNYIPKGILNREWIGPERDGYSPFQPNSVNDNHVSSRLYLDLSARVNVLGGDDFGLELFGDVTNVFDKDPPAQLRMNGNSLYFNPIGRAFEIGLRADL